MHHAEWLGEGPIGLGSRYNVDKEIRGQVRRYDTEVTRWEENRIYGFVSESPGFSRVDGVWEIMPEGDGCRFEMRETITLASPNPVANWFVKRGATKAIQGFLAQLKHLVERE
jgi:ribosome-associated toxin RatA of RatAB toxin-antitoxin module